MDIDYNMKNIRIGWVFKVVAFFVSIVAILLSLLFIFVMKFDNSGLRPSKEYVTDYISPTSRYAVKTLYDENKSPIDIVIIDAKSGVTVAGISQPAYSYKIDEVSSTLKFTLRDNEGVVTGEYEFDTKKGAWISNLVEISDEPSSYNEKKNDIEPVVVKQNSDVSIYGIVPTIIDNASDEDLRGLHSSIKHIATGLEYENSIYRFLISFPKSWGDIREKSVTVSPNIKVFAKIRLTAQNDKERYIEINIVENKYKDNSEITDAPQGYLTSNSTYSFYWEGSGDYAGAPGMEDQKYTDILAETKKIMQTFKLL